MDQCLPPTAQMSTTIYPTNENNYLSLFIFRTMGKTQYEEHKNSYNLTSLNNALLHCGSLLRSGLIFVWLFFHILSSEPGSVGHFPLFTAIRWPTELSSATFTLSPYGTLGVYFTRRDWLKTALFWAWVGNHIHLNLSNVITHPGVYFKGYSHWSQCMGD